MKPAANLVKKAIASEVENLSTKDILIEKNKFISIKKLAPISKVENIICQFEKKITDVVEGIIHAETYSVSYHKDVQVNDEMVKAIESVLPQFKSDSWKLENMHNNKQRKFDCLAETVQEKFDFFDVQDGWSVLDVSDVIRLAMAKSEMLRNWIAK